jgi:hypothetical protein
MFGTLANARLNTESVKGSNLIEVRHMIGCLDCGYILGQ